MKYMKYFEQFNVYHGSGGKFDNFDSDKLKSSMRSTTYGWGFYFTDSEEVAKNYASENDDKYIYHITLHKGKNTDMYDYLIFDDNLSDKQTVKVVDGLKNNGMSDFDMSKVVTGWDLMSSLFEYFYKSYDEKTQVIGGYNKCKKDTSLFLLDCGIDGLKYKMRDDTFSHESGYNGYNYVVFDSKNIFIDKINMLKSFEQFVMDKYKPIMETKLIDVFGDYPDETELIWNYVGQDEFENTDFKTELVNIDSVITDEFLESYNDNAEPWQKRLVKSYIKKIEQIKHKPIIVDFSDNRVNIIDGYHKLMAMYLAGIKEVNIIDINQ